jgi:hypothetical protein
MNSAANRTSRSSQRVKRGGALVGVTPRLAAFILALAFMLVALVGCASAVSAQSDSLQGAASGAASAEQGSSEEASSSTLDGENNGGFVVEDSATVQVNISDDEGEA